MLQKCTDLLTTLKIYDEEYSMYDSVLKPTNALVMAGLNLKAKYNEAADSEKAAAIKLSIDLINNYLKVLVTETRTLVATQLCRRLLSVHRSCFVKDQLIHRPKWEPNLRQEVPVSTWPRPFVWLPDYSATFLTSLIPTSYFFASLASVVAFNILCG